MWYLVHYFIFLGFAHQLAFVFSEDDVGHKAKVADGETRKNFTPNDLIQQLSRLADEQLQPRLRFPTSDFEDDPFYQSNLNSDEVTTNQQNYQSQYPQNYQSQNQQNYQTQQQNLQNYQAQQQNLQNYQTQNYQTQYQPNLQNPYFNFPNQNEQQFLGGNGIVDSQYQQNYNNDYQDQQLNRPQKIRRPKKQRPNRYNPPPVAQDPLDPYYQNYPPNSPYYPTRPSNYPQRPGFPFVQGQYQGQYPQYYPGQNPQQGYPGQNFGYDQYQGQGGPFDSLMNALNSIAKNDDQQCVPRLLCEVAAGGNPSYRQASFLPSFLNTESLFTLLSALSGSVSPLLVFGRAALLGVTSQGRPSSCRYAYPECPRDPDRLVDYLNNHNGGFFRFFNGLTGQQPFDNQQALIAGLLNQQNYPQRPLDQNLIDLYNQRPNGGPNYLNQRPGNHPGQFYNPNQYLAAQNQGTNYDSLYNRGDQYKYRRYPVRYDYQTRINQNLNDSDGIKAEARILNHNLPAVQNDDHLTFVSYQNYRLPVINDLDISLSYQHNRIANTPSRINGDFKFPENPVNTNTIPDDNNYYTKSTLKFPGDISNGNLRNPKAIFFPNSQLQENLYFPSPLPFYDHSKMIFPDRTGTGNLKFDSDKLTPSSYNNYGQDIYNNHFYTQNRPYFGGQYSPNQHDYYRPEPSKKKYVYIVRGNGDPSRPEIVEDVRGRSAASSDEDKDTPEDDDVSRNGRESKSWSFPSPYQGKVYND